MEDSKKDDNPLPQSFANKAWGLAKDHPMISSFAMMILLVVLVNTVGSGNNIHFIDLVITLLAISAALHFGFYPSASAWRLASGIFFCLLVSSVCLDDPMPLKTLLSYHISLYAQAAQPTSQTNSVQDSVVKPHVDNKVDGATTVASGSGASLASSGEESHGPRSTKRRHSESNEENARYIRERLRQIAADDDTGIHVSSENPGTTQGVIRSFKSTGAYLEVGCDQMANGSASFSLPAGAELVSAVANWIDQSNISQSLTTPVVQSGNAISATGTIRGLASVNIIFGRNCPGGGHATLQLSGEYRISQ